MPGSIWQIISTSFWQFKHNESYETIAYNCMQLPCWNRACVSAMSKKHIKDGLLKSLHTHTRLEKLCILQWKCIVAREIYLQSPFPHCFHRRTCCAQNWSATATPHLSLRPNRIQQYCWYHWYHAEFQFPTCVFLALEDYTSQLYKRRNGT